MCVAGLNVATQPCGHRWYQLVRACQPSNNLANCPERLRLEGWETRNDVCPFCSSSSSVQQVHASTHRLFGGSSPVSSVASSPTSPDAPGLTRFRRSSSSGTIISLSRQSSVASSAAPDVIDRAQMQREMNDRLLLYLTTDPHEVLPSAKKNYPTFVPARSGDDSPPSDNTSVNTTGSNGIFPRGWSKRVRFGKGIFKP